MITFSRLGNSSYVKRICKIVVFTNIKTISDLGFLLLTMLQRVKVIFHSKEGRVLGLSVKCFIAFW